MIMTIIGLLLLLSPFLLITRYKDKNLGFAYCTIILIIVQLLIAILTQSLQIFSYWLVLAINLAFFLVFLKYTDFKEFRMLKFAKFDWLIFVIILISFFCLYSVHYNYNGKYTIATSSEYFQAKNMVYPYPYFSDEWYAVSFIKYSIDYHSLPVKNSLYNYYYFFNLQLPFHSILSEMLLLLNFDPLTKYTLFTMFFNIFIILLIYVFLRFCRIEKLPASIAALSALYITSGANLPGIWNLLPMSFGILIVILGFFFIEPFNKKMNILIFALLILFYPPFILLYFPAIIAYFMFSKHLLSHSKFKQILGYCLAFSILFFILYAFLFEIAFFSEGFGSQVFNLRRHISFFSSKIVYPSFTGDYIPRFIPYHIIPLITLIFALIGAISVLRKEFWLDVSLLIGGLFWIVYSFLSFRSFIDYERAVYFSAILLVILSGFGINFLLVYFKKMSFFSKNNILNYIMILVLLLFFIFSFQYTEREKWMRFEAVSSISGERVLPGAPANQYLEEDDLKFFENISNENFLSLPWKGTVIGVATGNYPICIKSGTVSRNRNLYNEFIDADCDGKIAILKNQSTRYVYSYPIYCSGFELIGESNRGLILYKFNI